MIVLNACFFSALSEKRDVASDSGGGAVWFQVSENMDVFIKRYMDVFTASAEPDSTSIAITYLKHHFRMPPKTLLSRHPVCQPEVHLPDVVQTDH